MIIGIIHVSRQPDYIGLSISNLLEEFPGVEIHVFAEPGGEWFAGMSKVVVHKNEVLYGPLFNWLHGLETLSRTSTEDWILMCEDDIQWGKDQGKIFHDYLKGCSNQIGMVSGYCSKPNANPKKLGFANAKISPYGWCGALAIAIPRHLVPMILASKFIIAEWKGKHLDYVVGKTVRWMGKDIIVHTPTLVYHLGATTSTLLPSGHKNLFGYVRQAYDNPNQLPGL
jgi:hypothetical protein